MGAVTVGQKSQLEKAILLQKMALTSKGVLVTARFISRAVNDKVDQSAASNLNVKRSREIPQSYRLILSSIKSGKKFSRWLKACAGCISTLDRELIMAMIHAPVHLPTVFDNSEANHLLLTAPSECKAGNASIDYQIALDELWTYRLMLREYNDFLLNVTSLHQNAYSDAIIDMVLTRRFFAFSSPTHLQTDLSGLTQVSALEFNKKRTCLLMDSMHSLLARMVQQSPTNLKILKDRILKACPTIYSTATVGSIGNFARNLIHFGYHTLPILHSAVIDQLMNYAVMLDINSERDDESQDTLNNGAISSEDEAEDESGDEEAVNTVSEVQTRDRAQEESDCCETSADDTSACSESDDDVDGAKPLLSDPKVILLNEVLVVLADHLLETWEIQNSEEETERPCDEVFAALISNDQLLNSVHTRFSSAIILYAVSINADYLDWFVSTLLLTVFDGQRSTVVRLNSCCLLTILARFSYPDGAEPVMSSEPAEMPSISLATPPPSPIIINKIESQWEPCADSVQLPAENGDIRIVTQTLYLLAQYLQCSLDLKNLGPTFYHITNTIMYIFCFRHADIMRNEHNMIDASSSNPNMKWWYLRGGFGRILSSSRAAVVEHCSPEVTTEFLRICRNANLYYHTSLNCFTKKALRPQQRLSQSTDASSTMLIKTEGCQVNQGSLLMDMYNFPFDSSLLDLDIGQSRLKNYYREWIEANEQQS